MVDIDFYRQLLYLVIRYYKSINKKIKQLIKRVISK